MLPAYISMYHIQLVSWKPEENIGVIDSCELPCRCWDLNLGSLNSLNPGAISIGLWF